MSLWKKFQRVGKKAAKFRFTITYHELILEYDKKWIPNSVCIIWCRRNRKTASQWKKWEPSIDNPFRGVLTWPIPEVMEFEVTLYRDPNDPQTFEDKEWAIFVEDRGKDGRKKQQIAASTTIDLNRYVGGCCGLEAGNFELRLNLKPNGKKVKEATLAFTICSTFLKEGKATDEDMRSLASILSLGENGDQYSTDLSTSMTFSPEQLSADGSPDDISFGARVNELTREWSSLLIGPKDDEVPGTDLTKPLDNPKKLSFVDLENASKMFAKCNPTPSSSSPSPSVTLNQNFSDASSIKTVSSQAGTFATSAKRISVPDNPGASPATANKPGSPSDTLPLKTTLNGGYYGSLRVKNGQFMSPSLFAHAPSDKPSLANRVATSFRRKKSKGLVVVPPAVGRPIGPNQLTGLTDIRGNLDRTPYQPSLVQGPKSFEPHHDKRTSHHMVPIPSPERSNLRLSLTSCTTATTSVSKPTTNKQSLSSSSQTTYPNIEASLRSPAIDLLEWCKDVTSYYPGLKLDNFTSSFRDGRAFCAIINHFQPSTIDIASLSARDIEENNRKAFKAASDLGIPPLLEPYEMIQKKEPDKLAVITYLFQLKTFFERRAAKEEAAAGATTPKPATHQPNRSSEDGRNRLPRTRAVPFPGSASSSSSRHSKAVASPTLDELVSETGSYLLAQSVTEAVGGEPSPPPVVEDLGPPTLGPGVSDEPIALESKRKVPDSQALCPGNRSFPIYRQLPGPLKAHSLSSVTGGNESGKADSRRTIGQRSNPPPDPSSVHMMNEVCSVSRERELKTRALQLIKDAREKAKASHTPKPRDPPIDAPRDVAVDLAQTPFVDLATGESTLPNSETDDKSNLSYPPRTTPPLFPGDNNKVTALTNEYDFQWSDTHVEVTPPPSNLTKRPSVALTKLGSAFSSHVERMEVNGQFKADLAQTENSAPTEEAKMDPGHLTKELGKEPIDLLMSPVPSNISLLSTVSPATRRSASPAPGPSPKPTPKRPPKVKKSHSPVVVAAPNGHHPYREDRTPSHQPRLNDVSQERYDSPSYLAYSALRFEPSELSNCPPSGLNCGPVGGIRNGSSHDLEPDHVGSGLRTVNRPIEPFVGFGAIDKAGVGNLTGVRGRGKYYRLELENIAGEQNALDEQASTLENRIRECMMAKDTDTENLLMKEWFVLVDKKNSLLRQQTQLNLLEQEKNLEKKYDMLKTELQKIIDLPMYLKTIVDEEKEKALIEELVNVVNQRDELVQHLDDQEQGLEEDRAIATKIFSSSRQLFYNSLPRQLKRGATQDPSGPMSGSTVVGNSAPSQRFPQRSKMGPGAVSTLPTNLEATSALSFHNETSAPPPSNSNPNDANCLLQ